MGEKNNKSQLSVTFSISQDLDVFMFMVHSAAGSHCTDNLVGGSNDSSGFCTSASDCVISLGQYVWEVGRWKKIDSILVKLWNETFKNKYILQYLVLYCILEVLLPRNQRCDPFKCI